MMEIVGTTILGNEMRQQLPWDNNLTPTSGEFFHILYADGSNGGIGQSSRVSAKQPYILHTSLVLYKFGELSTAGVSGDGVTNVCPMNSTGAGSPNDIIGLFVQSLAKGATDRTFTTGAVSGGTGQLWPVVSLQGVIYARTTIPGDGFTLNGNKFISGGGNPVTDWTAASNHSSQPDSCVRKMTFTINPRGLHEWLLVTNRFRARATNRPSTSRAYVWNFTTSAWTLITNEGRGFGSTSGTTCSHMGTQWGFLLVKDYVGVDGEVYIRCEADGNGTVTIEDRSYGHIFSGNAQPLD